MPGSLGKHDFVQRCNGTEASIWTSRRSNRWHPTDGLIRATLPGSPGPARRADPQAPADQHRLHAVCGVLSGANSFAAIHEFAIDRRGWFARYLDLSNGIPSEDTFGRVLARLDPAAFEKCLLSWIQAVQEVTEDRARRDRRQDAPRLRRPARRAGRRSTWSRPGRRRTSCRWARWSSTRSPTRSRRSPNCCELLEISGALVTIDAMGCQKEIADADPRAGGRLRPGRQAEPADAVRAGRGGDRRGPGGGRRGTRRAPDRRDGARPSGDADLRGLRGAGDGRPGGAVARPQRRGDRDLGAGGFAGTGEHARSATTS